MAISTRPADEDLAICLRPPDRSDGPVLWEMVDQSGVLERNSCYTYLLLCRDFADTCVIAESDLEPLGFVTAYRPPERPEVIFIWQIAVAASARRQGLAQRMLNHLIARSSCRGVEYLEATVTPGNVASRRMFESLAAGQGGVCEYLDGFSSADFGPHHHEPEQLLRIGLPVQINS